MLLFGDWSRRFGGRLRKFISELAALFVETPVARRRDTATDDIIVDTPPATESIKGGCSSRNFNSLLNYCRRDRNNMNNMSSETVVCSPHGLDEALSCPICLEDFRKTPKILPTCGHSFCTPCLENWYEYSGGSSTGILRCPVCKSKTNLRILQGGSRKSRSPFGFRSSTSSSGDSKLPPPPLATSLKKLLYDSPTVGAVLKLRKKLQSENNSPTITKSSIAAMHQLLTCRACESRLEEPRMLPACRHSFCTGCLQKIYKPLINTTTDRNEPEIATVVCPVCSTLYRFNYHSNHSNNNSNRSSSPTILKTGNINNNNSEKDPLNLSSQLMSTTTNHAQIPPKEKLATYLPFDYVLGCLLDAVPEKL